MREYFLLFFSWCFVYKVVKNLCLHNCELKVWHTVKLFSHGGIAAQIFVEVVCYISVCCAKVFLFCNSGEDKVILAEQLNVLLEV